MCRCASGFAGVNFVRLHRQEDGSKGGREMQQLPMFFESMPGERVQRNSIAYKAAIGVCVNGGQ